MMRLVSILIPCYNAERWIGQAIQSALAQTWAEKEVIVVDDGSTDGSLSVVKQFGDHIRWETGPNRGGNATRNRLLELARGDWLQYLDADDYLLPNKVTDQMALVPSYPGVDIFMGLETMEHWAERDSRHVLLEPPPPHDPWILLAHWYLPQTGGPLWRRSALIDVGGWNPTQRSCQEYELYLRLLMAGKRFVYTRCTGAVYRQWGDETVSKRDKLATCRLRVEITRKAEAYLRASGELTLERQRAIHRGLFAAARFAWRYSHKLACEFVGHIYEHDQRFVPEGLGVTPSYRLAYRLLGFRATETVAAVKRQFFASVRHPPHAKLKS